MLNPKHILVPHMDRETRFNGNFQTITVALVLAPPRPIFIASVITHQSALLLYLAGLEGTGWLQLQRKRRILCEVV